MTHHRAAKARKESVHEIVGAYASKIQQQLGDVPASEDHTRRIAEALASTLVDDVTAAALNEAEDDLSGMATDVRDRLRANSADERRRWPRAWCRTQLSTSRAAPTHDGTWNVSPTTSLRGCWPTPCPGVW